MSPHVANPTGRGVLQSVRDAVDDRRTPRALFDPLNAVHRFTLDAAASDDNHLCDAYFTRHTDGLLRSWGGASRVV